MHDDRKRRAIEVFQGHGGVLKTSQVLSHGIHPRILYKLRDDGDIECLSRGLYCLSDSDILYHPDLVAAALRVPKGVVCLISALSFHGITTQIPRAVSLAIPRRMRLPVIDHPPTQCYRFSDASYAAGIESHDIQGIDVKIYSAEKTVADCFKFRNKIGLDVAVEALRLCRERKHSSPADILTHARVCRVERVMMPYLEAMFSAG
jgi:predicted transcriptional regulator of viral defense system